MAKGTALVKRLEESLEKKSVSMKRLSEKAKRASERTVESAATIGGGALGGYIHAEYGDREYFGLEAQTALGAVLTVAGIMELAGKQSNVVGALGEGMLAYDVGRRVAERDTDAKSGGLSNDELMNMMRNAAA